MSIAYDCTGAGPALILLHGGGGSRQEWYEAGYVQRLQADFTVIPIDLRGHGESALPTTPADYTIDKQMQDILAVASACGVDRFSLWGMSYGGKVGRYLATQAGRIEKIVLIGTPLGASASDKTRQEVEDFCAYWPPILAAQQAGTLDLASLPPDKQEFLRQSHVAAILGWCTAMLDWPAVGPADFLCPALWLIGSEDQQALSSFNEYRPVLASSRVRAHIVEGLNHERAFSEIDRVLDTLLDFMQSTHIQPSIH